MVPISGMVIWKSDSSSSRKASNSSSARSISSMSSTARSPARTASSSGRSSRNFGPNSLSTASSSSSCRSDSARICEHLPGVVPLVERLVGVDALVALQPDQPPAEHRGEDLGDLGLADADLALEQDRAAQRQRDEQRGGQPAVGEVAAAAQQLGQLGDGRRAVGATLAHRRPADRSGAVAAVSVTRAARGPGRGWCRPTCPACPRGRSFSRHAPLRSLPGSAKPSKLTCSMFLHDFVGLQSSSRSRPRPRPGRPTPRGAPRVPRRPAESSTTIPPVDVRRIVQASLRRTARPGRSHATAGRLDRPSVAGLHGDAPRRGSTPRSRPACPRRCRARPGRGCGSGR